MSKNGYIKKNEITAFIEGNNIDIKKLDKKISLHQSIIPIIFVIGTIFLIIHLIILNKYKKTER